MIVHAPRWKGPKTSLPRKAKQKRLYCHANSVSNALPSPSTSDLPGRTDPAECEGECEEGGAVRFVAQLSAAVLRHDYLEAQVGQLAGRLADAHRRRQPADHDRVDAHVVKNLLQN